MRSLLILALFAVVVVVLFLVGEHAFDPTPTSETPTSTSTTSPEPTTTTVPSTSTSLPAPSPAPVARSAPNKQPTVHAMTAGGSVWDRVAACESGGHWDDTRAGYFGGLHFMAETWRRAGGTRFAPTANLATREQQIEIAKAWLARTSVRQWPVCGPRSGLTMADAA